MLKTLLIELNGPSFNERNEPNDSNPIPLLVRLFALLRPTTRYSTSQLPTVIALLQSEPELAVGLRNTLLRLFSQRHAVLLLATSGIYPATGVFSETLRRISHKLLPEVDDVTQLKDGLRELLQASDAHWLSESRLEDWQQLIDLLGFNAVASDVGSSSLMADTLEALRVVAHRIAAAGLETEMLRLDPALENHGSPFLGVCEEALDLAKSIETQLSTDESKIDTVNMDIAQLEVLVAQARAAIARIRKRAQQQGASFHLTFHLRRLQQHLDRLVTLSNLLASHVRHDRQIWITQIAALWQELAVAECSQNKVRDFWKKNAELVALRVTENAGRSGEHYITETRKDYFTMLRAAAGGGLAVALVAALKINISARGLAPLAEVLANCLNYGFGFVLIHLLHFSVATKQPAMTANAIAAAIGEIQDNPRERKHDLEPLVTLVARTMRTQLAAIVGNIGLAIPVALMIAYMVQHMSGVHFVSPEKAKHLLQDINLFSAGTLIFGGVAGVCLFLAGLIAGYYDNLCSYSRIPERLNQLKWAQSLFGKDRWQRVSDYIRNNLGVLAGNFFLGFLLGGAAGLGALLGLPIDVRHTTLSSAMWGYSLFALNFQVPWQLIVSTALGFLGIGMMNLGVSFYLALSVALRARGVDFTQRLALLRAIGRRFRNCPRDFLLPPK
ncbi:preprotein translocase subunit TatB [Undibacterium flavidum]|uniref:Preprotein translocase subunit TatB n=1 Tax=Undibacterium flavidum TaxID=2762297 RepID=A0ABR6YFU4_9BURK|nr:preprotein translocase subunit TatB [Undibacterium flavidum]MBC3875446.1 preprotein translocase subunit TatB [Undibacterium flavidum]